MVQKWTDESEMQEEENNQKKGNQRFYYQSSKQKANPWSSSEIEDSDNYGFTGSKQKFGSHKSTAHVANSDFNLDSVWSLKNVPLPSNKKKPTSQLNLHTGNSYYSRHAGGISGGFQAKTTSKTESNGDTNNDGASWNVKRQGYSYTGQGSVKRQANDDDDDEFDFTEPKKKSTSNDNFSQPQRPNAYNGINSKAGSLASMVNPQRKGSARTTRAQKIHDAYLRSAGLGDYTSPTSDNDENRESTEVNTQTTEKYISF